MVTLVPGRQLPAFRARRIVWLLWIQLMSSSVGNWIVVTGSAILFVGICALLPMLGGHADPDQLMAGAGLLSLGALTLSSGIYLKARITSIPTPPGSSEEPAAKRGRGGCELCGSEAPVVQCKIHQLHLCGNCLQDHYDPRSCVYVPSARRTGSRNAKTPAAKARGA
jgi:hypothetical protein